MNCERNHFTNRASATLLVLGWVLFGCGGKAPRGSVPPKIPTFQVEATGSLAQSRCGHTATLLNDGRVLVVGGRVEGPWGAPLASAEIYNPTTGLFSPAGTLYTPRAGHSATLLSNGKVVIIGGVTDNWAFLSQIEIWDPTTQAFYGHGGTRINHTGHSTFLRADGRIQIVGGYNSNIPPEDSANCTEIYDPESGATTLDFRISFFRKNSLLVPIDRDRFLLIGGENGDGTWHQLDTCELYTTMPSGQSNLIASAVLPKPIRPVDGLKLGSDTVVVCGGYNQLSGDSDLAQFITVKGNTIAVSSVKLSRDLTSHQTILFSDGRIGLVGGETFTGFAPTSELDSIDVLEPTTGRNETLGSRMATRRADHAVVKLQNGAHLIIGGYCYSSSGGGGWPAIASCDLLTLR